MRLQQNTSQNGGSKDKRSSMLLLLSRKSRPRGESSVLKRRRNFSNRKSWRMRENRKRKPRPRLKRLRGRDKKLLQRRVVMVRRRKVETRWPMSPLPWVSKAQLAEEKRVALAVRVSPLVGVEEMGESALQE